MTTAELLNQRIQILPESLRYQLLGYADSLIEKWQSPVKNDNPSFDIAELKNAKSQSKDKGLTVDETLNAVTIKTDKHATVEQMNFNVDNQLLNPKIVEFGGILAKYTNKKLTIDDMNKGVARHFASMDKDEI